MKEWSRESLKSLETKPWVSGERQKKCCLLQRSIFPPSGWFRLSLPVIRPSNSNQTGPSCLVHTFQVVCVMWCSKMRFPLTVAETAASSLQSLCWLNVALVYVSSLLPAVSAFPAVRVVWLCRRRVLHCCDTTGSLPSLRAPPAGVDKGCAGFVDFVFLFYSSL